MATYRFINIKDMNFNQGHTCSFKAFKNFTDNPSEPNNVYNADGCWNHWQGFKAKLPLKLPFSFFLFPHGTMINNSANSSSDDETVGR